jgi:predicted RNA-binding Zn-ribbon protein involved in translation (DUF1610 family)
MKMHPSLTPTRILQAAMDSQIGLDDPGFCIACGAEVEGVEPDARRYKCEACGEKAVYGAEELALRLPR